MSVIASIDELTTKCSVNAYHLPLGASCVMVTPLYTIDLYVLVPTFMIISHLSVLETQITCQMYHDGSLGLFHL